MCFSLISQFLHDLSNTFQLHQMKFIGFQTYFFFIYYHSYTAPRKSLAKSLSHRQHFLAFRLAQADKQHSCHSLQPMISFSMCSFHNIASTYSFNTRSLNIFQSKLTNFDGNILRKNENTKQVILHQYVHIHVFFIQISTHFLRC